MIIAQTKILKKPQLIDVDDNCFVVVEATEDNLKILGINKFEEGLTIQPSSKFGIESRRNINGYYKVERNLPKEKRFIRTIYWEWKLYDGSWQSDYRDIYKECYPKTYYEPYGIEMTLLNKENDKKLILTKITSEVDIKNVINLYLEVFGYCEVLDEKLNSLLATTEFIRRNWEILPPDVKISVKRIKDGQTDDKIKKRKDFNQVRLDTLEKFNPVERNIGRNGFQGYYAYVFDNICILESPIYGNATYVIDRSNWKKASMETKKTLINDKQLLKRIEHNSNWFEEINELFN